jgi:TonB family protein
MSNFFSKCLGEIALMAAAVLWAGCNVDKDSKEEKSVSSTSNSFGVAEISKPVELPDSAAVQNVTEKDDSLSNEFQKDSLDANTQAVLLDSAKQFELQRTKDSLMKAFFPIERTHKEKRNRGLRHDIGCLLRYDSSKKIESACDFLKNIRTQAFDYGVVARFGRDNDRFLKNFLDIVSRGTVKVLYEKIESADKRILNQDMRSRVANEFRQSLKLNYIYGKFLKKNSANTIEGEITLKLTIAADGTVKETSIMESTTGVKEFDEEIRNAVSQWTFSKVKSGKIVVYVPIHFLPKKIL